MKLLLPGAAGMVARYVEKQARTLGHEVFAVTRAELDIADGTAVAALFDRCRPDWVINCAAWTDVDGCESDVARAFSANAHGPRNLAAACEANGASLVTISTDYVFDGTLGNFYTQEHVPNPQGVYARAKLEGEKLAAAACRRAIIVRSGWIFGEGGKNFLSQVIARGRRGERLKAIVDAYGTPTFGGDLATRLLELARLDKPGIYHVTNESEGASFASFAREALARAGLDPSLVEDTRFDDLKRPAPRPRDTRLRCLESPKLGLKPLRHWRDALSGLL